MMNNYKNLLRHVRSGYHVQSRNGSIFSMFGESLQFDLKYGFPILTMRRLHWNTILTECLWYLKGEPNLKFLHEHDVRIWDKWAGPGGSLGPVYGNQWQSWGGGGIDQIVQLENQLRMNPFSRRHLVSAWNVADLPRMALPPCPFAFQLHRHDIDNYEYLSMTVYQRSADLVIGVPHDIAVHALLLSMFAHVQGVEPRLLTMCFGDCHLYEAHVRTPQFEELLSRPAHTDGARAHLEFPDIRLLSVRDYTHDSIKLVGYAPEPHLSFKVLV